MSFLHPKSGKHADDDSAGAASPQVSELTPAEFDAQTDLALPHTGHEEEIDAGVGMLGSSLVPSNDHAGYDATRDVGFAPE